MRNLGTLWQRCQSGEITSWEYQRRLVVDNVQYYDDSIKDLSFNRALLFDRLNTGNVISSELNAVFYPYEWHIIPQHAEITLYIRIATANSFTDWFEFGTYQMQRPVFEDKKCRITAYDGLFYIDVDYLDGTEPPSDIWPKPCTIAIQKILDYMEVQLDPRTELNSAFFVEKPENMTMREVLRYIASQHGGNWCLTEENMLRLVVVSSNEPSLWHIDRSMLKRETRSESHKIDRVTVMIGNEERDTFTAGVDFPKFEYVFFNPFGSQAVANHVYETLKNYEYNTFSLQSVEIDPALELGDPMDVEGVPVNLWNVAYTLRLYADITIEQELEGGELMPGGGGGGGGRMAHVPRLFWDYNEKPIRIEQTKQQVTGIYVLVDTAGDGRGNLIISFMSDRDTTVYIRLYDNEVQALYSPIIAQVKKGYNEVGIPHSHIRVLTGLHYFTVTMQTVAGWCNISTRQAMHSIDFPGYVAEFLLPNTRDITLRQPEYALEPTDVYIVFLEDEKDDRGEVIRENIPSVLRARYHKGRWYIADDFTRLYSLELDGIIDIALEFEGIFRRLEDDELFTLVTKNEPQILYVDSRNRLWAQIGQFGEPELLADNVLQMSACQCFNSEEFLDYDDGFVAAYIKRGGTVHYRRRLGIAKGSQYEVWENECQLTEAGTGNSHVHVHRLNDYRVGFAVEGCNKLFVTKRTYVGMATPVEHVRFNFNVQKHLISCLPADTWGDDLFPYEKNVTWTLSNSEDKLHLYITCNYPLLFRGNRYSFTVDPSNIVENITVSGNTIEVELKEVKLSGITLTQIESLDLLVVLPNGTRVHAPINPNWFWSWPLEGNFAEHINFNFEVLEHSIEVKPLLDLDVDYEEHIAFNFEVLEHSIEVKPLLGVDADYEEHIAFNFEILEHSIEVKYVGDIPV